MSVFPDFLMSWVSVINYFIFCSSHDFGSLKFPPFPQLLYILIFGFDIFRYSLVQVRDADEYQTSSQSCLQKILWRFYRYCRTRLRDVLSCILGDLKIVSFMAISTTRQMKINFNVNQVKLNFCIDIIYWIIILPFFLGFVDVCVQHVPSPKKAAKSKVKMKTVLKKTSRFLKHRGFLVIYSSLLVFYSSQY